MRKLKLVRICLVVGLLLAFGTTANADLYNYVTQTAFSETSLTGTSDFWWVQNSTPPGSPYDSVTGTFWFFDAQISAFGSGWLLYVNGQHLDNPHAGETTANPFFTFTSVAYDNSSSGQAFSNAPHPGAGHNDYYRVWWDWISVEQGMHIIIDGTHDIPFNPPEVPLPATILLFAPGLFGLIGFRKKLVKS